MVCLYHNLQVSFSILKLLPELLLNSAEHNKITLHSAGIWLALRLQLKHQSADQTTAS